MEDYNISELLDEMKKNKEEQKDIMQGMVQVKNEYDATMKLLGEQYINASKNLDRIGNIKFPVRIGDLIDEISWLSNTNAEDIQVYLGGYDIIDGVYNMNSFLKLVGSRPKCGIRFRLSNRDYVNDDESSMFSYSNCLTFDLDSIQADGKTLLEHSSVIVRKRASGTKYTEFVIDKDINDVILPLTLNYVFLESSANWVPADLFTQAVINSVERYRDNTRALKRVQDHK